MVVIVRDINNLRGNESNEKSSRTRIEKLAKPPIKIQSSWDVLKQISKSIGYVRFFKLVRDGSRLS